MNYKLPKCVVQVYSVAMGIYAHNSSNLQTTGIEVGR